MPGCPVAVSVETRAYAKINLTLEVLGRRSDGYHEVRTVLQTIDLADRLRFAPSDWLRLECSEPRLAGEHNLVLKAAKALREAGGCRGGVEITLEKHIPTEMGLGGGSSDAAAALIGLSRFWDLDVGDAQLCEIGASLGSDVPFFIKGGTALGEGRGGSVTSLPPLPQRWVVLMCPPASNIVAGTPPRSKTARLYSLLNEQHYTDGSHTTQAVDALHGGTFSEDLLFNVFDAVAPSEFQGLEQARLEFLEAGVGTVHLAGSGPGLYAFVTNKVAGGRIVESLKSGGRKAYCVSTRSSGAPEAHQKHSYTTEGPS